MLERATDCGENKRARTCRTLRRGTAKRLYERYAKPRRLARARAVLVSENSRFSPKTVAGYAKLDFGSVISHHFFAHVGWFSRIMTLRKHKLSDWESRCVAAWVGRIRGRDAQAAAERPRDPNIEHRTLDQGSQKGTASAKASQSHSNATPKPTDSQRIATPKPP